MLTSPKLLKAYARFWLILGLIELAFVIGVTIYDPPLTAEESVSFAFLFIGLLAIGAMVAVAVTALRTTRRWLQIATVVMLGFNPLLFLLPISNSSILVYVLMPANFIAMCFVLYSLIKRPSTHPQPR